MSTKWRVAGTRHVNSTDGQGSILCMRGHLFGKAYVGDSFARANAVPTIAQIEYFLASVTPARAKSKWYLHLVPKFTTVLRHSTKLKNKSSHTLPHESLCPLSMFDVDYRPNGFMKGCWPIVSAQSYWIETSLQLMAIRINAKFRHFSYSTIVKFSSECSWRNKWMSSRWLVFHRGESDENRTGSTIDLLWCHIHRTALLFVPETQQARNWIVRRAVHDFKRGTGEKHLSVWVTWRPLFRKFSCDLFVARDSVNELNARSFNSDYCSIKPVILCVW